jgi:putative salt-induced outer membrane protein
MTWLSVSVWVLAVSAGIGDLNQEKPPAPPPPGFEGSAELSYVGTSGNSDTRSLGAGTSLTFRPGEWTVTSKAAIVRNEDQGRVRAQSTSAVTQVGRHITPALSVVTSHAYTRDQFAGINHRHTAEAGLSLEAVKTARHHLTLDAGVGYANEQRRQGANISTAIATSGVIYKVSISSTATFDNQLQTVISLDDASDRRLANVASLSARLNSLFSMKVKHTTRWVNAPVPGFRKTDTITAVALVATF